MERLDKIEEVQKEQGKDIKDIKDNHLKHIFETLTEVHVNQTWLMRFFWIVATGILYLVIRSF